MTYQDPGRREAFIPGGTPPPAVRFLSGFARWRSRAGEPREAPAPPPAAPVPALPPATRSRAASSRGGQPRATADPYAAQPRSRPADDARPGSAEPVFAHEDLRPVVFVRRTGAGSAPWRLPSVQPRNGVAADQAVLGDLQVRAASVVGPAHRRDEAEAQPRQDSYCLLPVRQGRYLVAAVADGVSSARFSATGSANAARMAVETVRATFEAEKGIKPQFATRQFATIANALADEANRSGDRPSDYATTLIVAIVPARADVDGGRSVWLAWLGDSSAWLLGTGGWLQVAGQSKDRMDCNVLDAYLPGHPEKVNSATVHLPAGQALVLMTDGLGDALNDVSSMPDALCTRWASPPSLLAFLRDLCFDAPGQDDDRTAVAVWTPDAGREEI